MSGIRFDVRDLEKGLDRHRMMTEFALNQAGSLEAKRMAIYAQSHRPWQDRTGNARRSIHGRAGFDGNQLRISVAGGMDYMVYLEYAHGKKWAILWPTIRIKEAEAIENIAKFMAEAMK